MKNTKKTKEQFLKEVTKLQKQVAELGEPRVQRDRTQQYLDLAGTIFVAIDTKGIVTLINRKGCGILGYKEKEIVGKNWFEHFIPERIKKDILPVSDKLLSGEVETAEYYENPILTKKGTGRVLVVDDEELIREITEEILLDLGYKVSQCIDGVDAVDFYRKNHDNIDLIILDMSMPKLSGYDCFLELKKINPEVKVIVSSGYADDDEQKKKFNIGISGFLRKPFSIESLSKAVSKVMSKNT
jgi:PAS domain S-box-containing protein